MIKSNASQLEAACRLLGLENHSASAAYRRLHATLGPLIGTTSVLAIFSRSVKLTAVEIVTLQALLPTQDYADDAAEALDAWQRESTPNDTTARVFATFIALLTGLIGERLTMQVMETTWKPSEENKP